MGHFKYYVLVKRPFDCRGAVNLMNYVVKIAPNPSMKSLVIAIEYSVKLTAPSSISLHY